MKQFKILILILITISFSSCNTIKEGFKNQKKNNTDEFLVEKKSPLVMPPNFDDLPIPKEKNVNQETDENQIKKLISKSESGKIDTIIDKKSRTFEESLLKKIKEN